MSGWIKTYRKAAAHFALEYQAQFLREKQSGLYKMVLLASTAAENCAWDQEAGKISALPRIGQPVRRAQEK